MTIKVSVCVISFNHEDFIEKTLRGILAQKINFPLEILVYDDASVDGTPQIIKNYAQQYPSLVKPFLSDKNCFSQGIHPDKVYNWPRIQGNYVALCEGDDYWTDPYKLQKQADFLDQHPQYSLCFHPVKVIIEGRPNDVSIFPTKAYRFGKQTLDLNDLLKHNFIQTNSVLYRWRFHHDLLNLYPDNILPGDYFLHLLHAQVGKIGFLPDVMAVYRRHCNGLWSNTYSMEWFKRVLFPHINFYQAVEKQFQQDQILRYCELCSRLINVCISKNNFELFEIFKKRYPEVWQRVKTRALHQCFPWKAYLKYKLSFSKKRLENKEQFSLLRNVYNFSLFLRSKKCS